jgi:hypothetical protein
MVRACTRRRDHVMRSSRGCVERAPGRVRITRACLIVVPRGRTRQGSGEATWGGETAQRLLDD